MTRRTKPGEIKSKRRSKTRTKIYHTWHTRKDVYDGQTWEQRKKKHKIKGRIPIVRDLL